MRRILKGTLMCSVALCLTTKAFAAPVGAGTYQLFDHGHGQLGPYYGLRLDGHFNNTNQVFSASSGGAMVSLTWDGNQSAVISGTLAYNSNASTPPATNAQLSTVTYTLSNITVLQNGFTAIRGSGEVCGGVLATCINLIGKQKDNNGPAFEFLGDGHRIDNNNDSLVGRGWVNGDGPFNDWLVKGPSAVVPVPAALPLLGSALGILGFAGWRRRRKVTTA